MVQKERKSGHWQVERFVIPQKRTTWSPPALQVVVDLQPWGLQMAIFSYLLQHKGALIFQIKRPLFWKNGRICPSLEQDVSFSTSGFVEEGRA